MKQQVFNRAFNLETNMRTELCIQIWLCPKKGLWVIKPYTVNLQIYNVHNTRSNIKKKYITASEIQTMFIIISETKIKELE